MLPELSVLNNLFVPGLLKTIFQTTKKEIGHGIQLRFIARSKGKK
jgi:hypothetical protein